MKDRKFHSAVLGVTEDAPTKLIRRAYRRLAQERHPDKHGNSPEATAAFQQLSESYRYLLEHRRSPDSTRGQNVPNPIFRRNEAPVPQPRISRPPAGPPVRKRLWLHAGLACLALLGISLFFERRSEVAPPYQQDASELAAKAFCVIQERQPGEKVAERSEFLTSKDCDALCTRDGSPKQSCAWNGLVFHKLPDSSSAQLSAPAAPAPRAECRLELELSDGKLSSNTFPGQSEAACRAVCLARKDQHSRAGVRCSWGELELLRQARVIPRPDPPPAAHRPRAEPVPEASGSGPSGTCYMSIAIPGNMAMSEHPGDSIKSCIERCQVEILAHPLDRVVRCSYEGREVVTHVPDPLSSYLARNPAQAGRGVQLDGQQMAICEIYAELGGKRVDARAGLSAEEECKSRCNFEFARAIRNSQLSCSFAGSEFFRRQVPE